MFVSYLRASVGVVGVSAGAGVVGGAGVDHANADAAAFGQGNAAFATLMTKQ